MQYSQYPEAANDSVVPDGTVDFDGDNPGQDVTYQEPSDLAGPDGEDYDDGEIRRQLNRSSGKGAYIIMTIIAVLAIAALAVGSTLLVQNNQNRSIEQARQDAANPPSPSTPAANTYAPTFRGTNSVRTYAPTVIGTNIVPSPPADDGDGSPASDPAEADSSSAGTPSNGTSTGNGGDDSGTDGSGTNNGTPNKPIGADEDDGGDSPPSTSGTGEEAGSDGSTGGSSGSSTSDGEVGGDGTAGGSNGSTTGAEGDASGGGGDGSTTSDSSANDGSGTLPGDILGGSSGSNTGGTDSSSGGSDGVGADDGATGGSSGSTTSTEGDTSGVGEDIVEIGEDVEIVEGIIEAGEDIIDGSPTVSPGGDTGDSGVGSDGDTISTPATIDGSTSEAGNSSEGPPIVLPEEGHLGADGCLKEDEIQDDICLPDEPIMPRAVSCCSGSIADDSLTCERGPTCYKAATYSDAVARCEGNSMRLCTVAELGSGVCCNQGCDYDFRINWTSDVCGSNIGPSPTTAEPVQTGSPTTSLAPALTWSSIATVTPTTGLSECTIGGVCSEERSTCAMGNETCCGVTYDSIKCECSSGQWECYVTEACMFLDCEETTGPSASGTIISPSTNPIPTLSPTISVPPSAIPSSMPSMHPTRSPSTFPSSQPSASPTSTTTVPSFHPSSDVPSVSSLPSTSPTALPSVLPTSSPSTLPSSQPTCTHSIEVAFVTEEAGNLDETGYTLLSVAGTKSLTYMKVLPGQLAGSTSQNDVACVTEGTYNFTVNDESFKCCGDNKGYYTVNVDGEEVVRGGSYFTSPNAYIIRTDYQPPTADAKAEWLNKHNDVRETFQTENGVSFRQLVWSEGLTQAAAVRANDIAPTCGPGSLKDIYGENIARTVFGGYNETFVTPDYVFDGWDDPEEHPFTFRQIMWRPTRYVGCATKINQMFADGHYCYVAVCKYARPGNCNVNNETWLNETLADYSKCDPSCPEEGCF